MQCKICGKIATRSSIKGVYCEEHYWEYGKDGSSVTEKTKKMMSSKYWNGHGYSTVN